MDLAEGTKCPPEAVSLAGTGKRKFASVSGKTTKGRTGPKDIVRGEAGEIGKWNGGKMGCRGNKEKSRVGYGE